MKVGQTTFITLFTDWAIKRIKIPVFQRDYAQGRGEAAIKRIRQNFLDDLYASIMSDSGTINWNFVYGDVEKGTFYPLDGQQRLTTLFLIHWYLAWSARAPIKDEPWMQFLYSTRESAEEFCRCLSEFQPPYNKKVALSIWFRDQYWFRYTWDHDPTIQSMLVMLDAIELRFDGVDKERFRRAWNRLNDPSNPVAYFQLMLMPADGRTNDMYIKMNSRGKPLTDFETFKARFEGMLHSKHPERVDDISEKIDTDWSDIFWIYRDEDNAIDEQIMRYFHFVTLLCAWTDGNKPAENVTTEEIVDIVYNSQNLRSKEHLTFLFHALDTWHKINIRSEFDRLFSATRGTAATPLVLYNYIRNVPKDASPVDLFGARCQSYGRVEWSLAHSLYLYAVLITRGHESGAPYRQLRVLRNLVEASIGSELRHDRMPELLADVTSLMAGPTLQRISALSQAQLTNEAEKKGFLDVHPALESAVHALEDHKLLRGCLSSFDLDPSQSVACFERRADAFRRVFDTEEAWAELTGALLAIGDYSRRRSRWTGYQVADFGSAQQETSWRDLLKGRRDDNLVQTLMKLLDNVAARRDTLECLRDMQRGFLEESDRALRLCWRYYFVKYRIMRSGKSGRYVINESGYSACMLDKITMSSRYRDPYLSAIVHVSEREEFILKETLAFSGYETNPRRVTLKRSGSEIECVEQGWNVSKPPEDLTQKAAFDNVCSTLKISAGGLYMVPQAGGIDTKDRVVMGAHLLTEMVGRGL